VHQRFNTYKHRGVAIREFLEKVDFGELAANIDKAMQGGHVLKNGNTCFVSHVGLGGEEIVIKRYNHKGIIHSLRHTMKGSRARRGWLHANRLTLLNIATPKPLAYLEHRKGPIVWKSYFITEHVEGQKLCDLLRDDTKNHDEHVRQTAQLRAVLKKLDKYHITHGDLKYTNILVTDNGPVLTDLDAMKVHTCRWIFQIRRRKDIARLTANMEIDWQKDENKG
jgi:tRNA A-37 threonylcarbamoyl transferase component Bud32